MSKYVEINKIAYDKLAGEYASLEYPPVSQIAKVRY